MCHSSCHCPSSYHLLWFLIAAVLVRRSVVPWRLIFRCLFLIPSPIPLHAPCLALPFLAHVASPPSFSPLLLLVRSASYAACPIRSGARRWRTAPDTNRTRICGRPDGRRTAWSCRTTDARNRIRHCRNDKPVVLVPWWLSSAPSPPHSPFPPPLS